MSAFTAASQRSFQSWGRYPESKPIKVINPQSIDAPNLLRDTNNVLGYGQGRSYGDVCLNNGGTLLSTNDLDRVICFNTETGLLKAESGVTLAQVLERTVPSGWFLPVSPGTKFVSLGGAVANDIHGKNHHKAGTFGRHVKQLELLRSTGERLVCSPQKNTDLFKATIAGLGLTGLITWVEIQLKPIESENVDIVTTKFYSLDEFLELSESANKQSPYVVAWIDSLAKDVRGLLMHGDHSADGSLPETYRTRKPLLRAPFNAPSWVLSPFTLRGFNKLYFNKQLKKVRAGKTHFDPFFYPLDGIRDWNRLYGRHGLFQYQCVVPFENACYHIRELLQLAAGSKSASFLTVMKVFGDVKSPGLMSFPRPGITLNLDFPNRGKQTRELLRALDTIVCKAGGAVYPAKDACMTPESFQTYFPEWKAFSEFIDPAFSSTFWRRVTS